MPISILQPGEPLTYDVINNIIKAITDVQTQLNIDSKESEQKQIIKVMGSIDNKSLNKADTLVKVGQFRIGKKELKSKLKFEIPFFTRTTSDTESSGGAGFSSAPMVVACLADDQDNKDTLFANIIVSNVTKKTFNVKINLISKIEEDTQLKINFIAIGPYGNSNKS